MSRKRMPRRGIEFWGRHVKSWRRSGQDQAAYCRRHGLQIHSLQNWSRKLMRGAVKRGRKARFVPITLEGPSGRFDFEVALKAGRSLRFSSGFEVERVVALAEALEALEALPC